jgi:hypothetical protein
MNKEELFNYMKIGVAVPCYKNHITRLYDLLDSIEKQNRVFGVDVEFSTLKGEVNAHPNYTKLLGDSSTLGKNWKDKIEGLFVDTIHVKEQVMCELYFWYPHVKEGGFIAFHDSNWPGGKYDFIGGETWPRVEEGIYNFFGIKTLNYEDEFISVKNYPESYGMTFVTIKKKKDYVSLFKDWKHIFERRNKLLSNFFNENIKFGGEIELEIHV